MAPAVQHLPVKAIMEGPSACFRLLGIDDSLGMKHADYIGLFYSATDNRMHLEDIQEAWDRYADGIKETVRDPNPANTGMLLPFFLQAFTALARIKFCNIHEGKGGDHLLLRDVFDNITNPTSVATRYGICACLVREDVCSELLSQRPLTTYLFAVYGEAPTPPRRHGETECKQACALPSPPKRGAKEEPTPVSENGSMAWAGFLAISSDLQLIPRLVGLDDLQAAVEQVSVAPHRVERDTERDFLLNRSTPNRNTGTKRSVGMSYPQFVEVLVLLAASAARRLRNLYPDVAGEAAPSPTKREPRKSDCLTDFAANTIASRNGRSPLGSESAGVDQRFDLGGGAEETTRNPTGQLIHRKAIDVRTAIRLQNGRSRFASCDAPTSDAEFEQVCLPYYDVGALKALFHHVQAVLEEKHHRRDRSRGSISSFSVSPGDGDHQGADASPSVPRRGGGRWEIPLTGDDGADDGVSDREDWKMSSALECEGAMAVVGTRSGLQKVFSPLESARILGETVRRVSDLEARNLPRETSDDGASLAAIRARADDQPTPDSLDPGAGGAFARLVVVKELQPVPEHAPEDARHLLELTLDHQQAGRYPLALESLHKGVTMWGEVGGADESGLEAADETLVLLLEASVFQSMGRDDDALSALLRADGAVTSIHQDEDFRREALRATVLSEMGVALYYSGQTALSLRCFRLALVLRHKFLRSNDQQHVPETEAGEPACEVDEGSKQAPSYGIREDSIATEAGETAAAITLNNFAVCLAGIGDTIAAAQALVISSAMTTSALGVEHPRSSIVSRNLAIVKATKGRPRGSARDGRKGVGIGGPAIDRWDQEIWQSLGSRRGTSLNKDDLMGDVPLCNSVAQSTARVIPGGFFFAGELPVNGVKPGSSNGRQKKKKKAVKKRGKSARRR